MSGLMDQATRKQPSISAARLEAPAGGGAFAFERLSIGVFLVDQPEHRISVGSDKRLQRPLRAHEGWILPAGATGVCEFDSAHSFVSVEIGDELLSMVGFDARRAFAPRFGAHDPLLLQMALAAAAPQSGASTLYLETMRQALAAHIAHGLRSLSEAEAIIGDMRLRRAVAYIQDHLASDISLEALAAEAAMSPFHFSRAFKAATGRSPLQYVISERLSRAETLLRTTSLPVAEIAHRVGYQDVSRFGRHFKRQFGVTPNVMRG